ncbi:MAG: hypothetical protein MJ079_01130 [Ruminococcus sp.]|nr:hypothetical protein [Ruminococcus sp.]
MNIKRIIAMTAAAAMLALSAACGSDHDTSAETGNQGVPGAVGYDSSITAAEDGPELMFSNVEAAAGEVAEVSLFVNGAVKNWNTCGLHITFDDALTCEMEDPKQNTIKYELGAASKRSIGSVGMLWTNKLPEELTSNHLGSLFFTEIFEGNMGGDGEIAKFFFKVPENAKSGTVYNIGIYYLPPDDTRSDMFRNVEGDLSLEKYAFENWKGGTVTVK